MSNNSNQTTSSPERKSSKTLNVFHDPQMNWLKRIDKDWREIYQVPKEKRTLKMYELAYRKNMKALNCMPKKIRQKLQIKSSIHQQETSFNNIHDFPNFPDERKTEAMCLKQVRKKGINLLYVPNHLKTYEMCKIAVTNDFVAFQCVPIKFLTTELFYIAQKQAKESNQLTFFKSLDIYKVAIRFLTLDPNKIFTLNPPKPQPKIIRPSNTSNAKKIKRKTKKADYYVPHNGISIRTVGGFWDNHFRNYD